MNLKLYISLFIGILTVNTVFAQVLDLKQFANGFIEPVEITNANDERLFVVERSGIIKILLPDGSVLPEPFIDLQAIVHDGVGQNERGLLGLAFHPNYENNGFFYLNYIDLDGHTNVVRYSVSENDSNIANVDSRELIIHIEQPAWNHNGGCIKFGADGLLYIGMGDGGSGNDPWNNSQNTSVLLGKMLRLDVDNGLPYTIPSDNPFVGDNEVLDEIWAIGMRNPWKFSFDKETGDLWIADVGQDEREEVNFEAANDEGGKNYGWRCYEGTYFTGNSLAGDCNETYIDPVFETLHVNNGGPCSITGGYVYRGSIYDNLKGKYIGADFCSGDFYFVEQDEQGQWQGHEVAQFNVYISTFGEDINGELYIASYTDGTIYKIEGEPTNTVDEDHLFNSIEVVPNPFADVTNLRISTKEVVDINVTVTGLSGKIVFEKEMRIQDLKEIPINLESQPNGTYIINISSDSGIISRRIIKQ